MTEYLKGKNILTGLAIIVTMCNAACIAALVGIKLSILGYFSYKLLFLVGITIFALGYFARRSLTESPEFIKAKESTEVPATIDKKAWLASLLLNCMAPVGLFLSLIGMQNLLRTYYNYTDSMLVNVSLYGVIYCTVYGLLTIYLSRRVSPFVLATWRICSCITLLLLLPMLLTFYMNEDLLIVVAGLLCLTACGEFHMNAVMYKNIPVIKRFRFASINFALSRCVITVLSTLGLVALVPIFGNFTYTLFGLPFAIGYLWAINYFKTLDESNPNGILKDYK